jgi:hypothetical protein
MGAAGVVNGFSLSRILRCGPGCAGFQNASDIPKFMRFVFPRLFFILVLAVLAPHLLTAQQAPEGFRWIDFHAQSDQDVVIWVTRALTTESWTAIREIGVQYDAALVITTQRATPQSATVADTYTVWSVSLTNHALTQLLKGVNLRLLDWMMFAEGRPRELAAFYDNCAECQASTFFTAFHYDISQRTWAARWMRGDHAAPVWSANTPAELTQVYAVMAEPDGREFLSTWRHFDYGKQKPVDDFVYIYDEDPVTTLDRSALLSGQQADAMKQRLCRPQDAVSGLARGQDSALCQPAATRSVRQERRPVTTPPANNHGQSLPPGTKH